MNDRDPDQDILDEYERRRAEGTDLDGLQRVNLSPSSKARATFSIRLSKDEMGIITQAARKRGVSLTDFIRDVSTSAARAEVSPPDDLAEMKRELDNLRKRVNDALSSQSRTRAGV
jgi:hypothetical protein